jgi:hypothetical protein
MSIQNRTAPVRYRNLPDLEGYRFGNDGSAWSQRQPGTGKLTGIWRRLKSALDRDGYPQLCLRFSSRHRTFKVHQLVCRAFHGPCPNGMVCRHRDGNPKNAKARNLFWGTVSQNTTDRVRHGTHARGERVAGSKLTERQVRRIRQMYTAGRCTQESLGTKFGVSQAAIWFVLNRTWQHVK